MSVKEKKWILDTVENLSYTEIEELQKYLKYLIWKSQLSRKDFRNQQDSPNPEPKGQPKKF